MIVLETYKRNLSIVLLLFTVCIYGQKAQKLAYVDMNYILKEIPDYQSAQLELDQKVILWNTALSQLKGEIDQMKLELEQQRILLTETLIENKEDEIYLKELEYKKIELSFFGPEGSLFKLRAQLVAPIQDQVYNAIQEIAKRGKYDFVVDRSSDLIMLYSNKKYDISDLVVRSINKTEKEKLREEKINSRDSLSSIDKEIIDTRQSQLDAQRQAKLAAKAKRDSVMLAKKEARLKALQERNKQKDSIK